MKNKVHLIMPMGGAGSRFFKGGFIQPKPLIEIKGKPFFYWATKSIEKFVDIKDLTFVVLQEHVDKFNIKNAILNYFPQANVIVIPELLKGAVLTCNAGLTDISDDLPIIFNDCDQMFICKEFYDYCNAGEFADLDGILLSFKSNEPKYSFLEIEDGYVINTVEKIVVSDNAICGCYYFKNKAIFQDALEEYLKVCNYSEYFVSGVYNVLAKKGKKIKHMSVDLHLPFGTPEEYELAEKSDDFKRLL